MKRKSPLLLFFILTSLCVSAQQWPFEVWHDGKIVLENKDTLRGLVKYDLQQDVIQYTNKDESVEAYTPRKVLFFEIFDSSVHKWRQFYSLPFTATGAYRTQVFFELLEEGKLTLLSREALEYKTYNSAYYVGGYTRQVLVTKFFLLDEKGNIEPFVGNKRDLLNLMEKKSDDVQEFIKANRLDYTEKYDLAKIVQYYNSLMGS
jgi:hypothetical protein